MQSDWPAPSRAVTSWVELYGYHTTTADGALLPKLVLLSARLAPGEVPLPVQTLGLGTVVTESLAWRNSGNGVVGVGADGRATLHSPAAPLHSPSLQV